MYIIMPAVTTVFMVNFLTNADNNTSKISDENGTYYTVGRVDRLCIHINVTIVK